jgi:hypothetical protein
VFRIEERRIDTVAYRNNSAPQQWDDLEYTFNFEYARLLGLDPTRIASQLLDVVRDTEYTLVLRGSLETPTVNIWEIAERSFTDADTVFEMRLGHAADVLGPIDVYIGTEGVAPAPGAQAATLAPGEVSIPSDIEAGTYVITVTTAGDAADILFESVPAQIAAGQSLHPCDDGPRDLGHLRRRGTAESHRRRSRVRRHYGRHRRRPRRYSYYSNRARQRGSHPVRRNAGDSRRWTRQLLPE